MSESTDLGMEGRVGSGAGGRLRRFAALSGVQGVAHGVSERGGGVSGGCFASLNLGLHVGDREEDVIENRRRLAAALGCALDALCFAEQVHGAEVAPVGASEVGAGARDRASALSGADALVSDQRGAWLVVLVADCVPILLADPVRGVVGAAHAGWRGTVEGVARATVESMVRRYGSDPRDLVAGIGPAIGPDHFEVGPEVASAFRERFPAQAGRLVRPGQGDRSLVDLWAANRLQLERAGLRPERIEIAGVSTVGALERYYSHRAEGGRTGRFAACIARTA